MTSDDIIRDEAVRLAEKHGASVGGNPAYGQPPFVVFSGAQLSALIAEVQSMTMSQCARSALAEPVQEPVARRDRLNPPPHVLSDALQDRVHSTLDKGRAVKTLRIKPGVNGRGEMTTAWANLPNAVHIDRILAHLKAHPDKWAAAQRAYLVAVLDAVRGEARDAARWVAARGEARGEAWAAAWGVAWGVAWDAIAALIAWDDAGELFSQPIEAVKAMADVGECAAVLIYPAMLAMGEDK